jgi:hypothetical protein
MKKYRPIFAAALALIFYTFADILIWQRIFETNQMVQFADIYHTGWKDCLYYLISLIVGAFCGLEDVLYYLLDGKPMPASLPWLEDNPMIFHVSRMGVLGSVSLWLVGLVVLYLVLYQWRAKSKQKTLS